MAATARNKQRTQARFVEAVGSVLAREGFRGLGINRLADEAGLDKVLIYRYFDGLSGLLEAAAREPGLWPGFDQVVTNGGGASTASGLPAALAGVLRGYQRTLVGRPDIQEIVAWETVEPNAFARRFEDVRRDWGQAAAETVFRARKAPADADIEAILALLIGGINYLVARARHNGVFNGLDASTGEGRERLERALLRILQGVLGGTDP